MCRPALQLQLVVSVWCSKFIAGLSPDLNLDEGLKNHGRNKRRKKDEKRRTETTNSIEPKYFEGIALGRADAAVFPFRHPSTILDSLFSSTFSPTAECYGVFAQYRFRCVLGELGRFRDPVPGTGSGNQFWEPDPGFDGFRQVLRFQGSGSIRFRRLCEKVSKVSVFDGFRGVRFCSRGFDGTVSGNQVPGTRAIKKVPGQGFRQLLCTSKVYSCTLKVYFCTLKVCFCTLKVSFCNLKVYFESMLLYFNNILSYFESMLLYFESMLFPQTGLPVGFYLRKNRLDTLVGALGLVGRGFGPAGRAGLGWA